jgi:hypothetical protein
LAVAAGACTGGPNLPALPLLLPPSEAGGAAAAGAQVGPHETALTVPGTPTEVFTAVARGALGCWFAATGPLKASHVYRAEAEPPAKGGAAWIIVYERDGSVRDQRGAKAYHVTFAGEASGVRVATTSLKFETAAAQAMARDVEAWAKGGASCQLRTVLPPPPAVASAAPAGKGKKAAAAPAGKKTAAAPAGKKTAASAQGKKAAAPAAPEADKKR